MDPKEKKKYVKTWLQKEKKKRQEINQKREKAFKKARKISKMLKEDFKINSVILFGSLAENKFWQHSDIDLAVKGLAAENYLTVFSKASDIASPFKVDLVIIEDAPESLLKKINNKGMKL